MVKKLPTILIVDDEEVMLKTMVLFFVPYGYNILEAANGKEGLKVVDENEVDLIITDHRMPEMKGLDMVKVLRKKGNNIPIIMVTGFATEELEEEAKKEKVDIFLTRPVDIDVLLLDVKRLLKQKGFHGS